MSEQHITTEPRTCINPQCKKPYTAEIGYLFGVKIVIGMGYCPDCRKKYKPSEPVEETAPERIARRTADDAIELWYPP